MKVKIYHNPSKSIEGGRNRKLSDRVAIGEGADGDFNYVFPNPRTSFGSDLADWDVSFRIAKNK